MLENRLSMFHAYYLIYLHYRGWGQETTFSSGTEPYLSEETKHILFHSTIYSEKKNYSNLYHVIIICRRGRVRIFTINAGV